VQLTPSVIVDLKLKETGDTTSVAELGYLLCDRLERWRALVHGVNSNARLKKDREWLGSVVVRVG